MAELKKLSFSKSPILKFFLWKFHKFVLGLVLELVSKELNHLAAILHVYAGGLNFMK